MRTYTYFIQHEVYDDEASIESWVVYCGVTTHCVEGDRYDDEYQTSCATKAEAEAVVASLSAIH